MLIVRTSFVVATAVALGCGGGDSGSESSGAATGSRVTCVVTEMAGGTTIYTLCEEGTGFYADQVRAACSRPPATTPGAPHAVINSDPCPRANALGACTITTNVGSFTGWHYADGTTTADQIAMICAQTGQMFIAP